MRLRQQTSQPMIIFAALAVILGAGPAQAQDDEREQQQVLADAYRGFYEDPELTDAVSRHRQVMNSALKLSEFTEAGFQCTENLERWAYSARLTGYYLGCRLDGVKSFQFGLKKIVKDPAFARFQTYAKYKGYVTQAISISQDIYGSPDLPRGAKNTLAALQVLSTALDELSNWSSFAGVLLKGYATTISGIATSITELAGHATATTQAGAFTKAEETEYLANLDRKKEWIKTPLWHRKIPLVQEFLYGGGQEEYCLRKPDGTWLRNVDYETVAGIAADYRIETGKDADVQQILGYMSNSATRTTLQARAAIELDLLVRKDRRERVCGDLKGVHLSGKEFTEMEDKLKAWYKGFLLPLDLRTLDNRIRSYAQTPEVVERAIRNKALSIYPGFREYILARGQDPLSISMDAALERFGEYRAGRHLVRTVTFTVSDGKTRKAVPGCRVTLTPKMRGSKPLEATCNQGGVAVFDAVALGEYTAAIRADKYAEVRREDKFLPSDPMTLARIVAMSQGTRPAASLPAPPDQPVVQTSGPPPKTVSADKPALTGASVDQILNARRQELAALSQEIFTMKDNWSSSKCCNKPSRFCEISTHDGSGVLPKGGFFLPTEYQCIRWGCMNCRQGFNTGMKRSDGGTYNDYYAGRFDYYSNELLKADPGFWNKYRFDAHTGEIRKK